MSSHAFSVHRSSSTRSKLLRWASAGLLVLLLSACSQDSRPPVAQAEPELPQAAAILTSLEPRAPIAGQAGWTLEERMRRYNAPALSLAVFDEYEIVWTAAFGMADVEAGIPATPSTLFQAGSISKPVAAAAVLAAAERGELDLDAPINTLLESWQLPANEHTAQAEVTPRRLLSHTAGTTVHGFPGYARDVELPTVPEILDGTPPANTAAVRVDIVPGTMLRYSGGGSTIMQLAMTDLTGLPFPELLRRTVLEPVGMVGSTYEQPLPASLVASAAAGYRGDGRQVWGQTGASIRFQLGDDGRAVGYVNTNDEEAVLRPRLDAAAEPYVALLDAGRTDDAVARLAADSIAEASLNRLGYTLLAYHRPEQAVAVFRLAVERYPNSVNACDSLADGYLALDDFTSAAEVFRELLSRLDNDPEIAEERKARYAQRARMMLPLLEDRLDDG